MQGEPPLIDFVTSQLQRVGYASWAHRVLNTAGDLPCCKCEAAAKSCLLTAHHSIPPNHLHQKSTKAAEFVLDKAFY